MEKEGEEHPCVVASCAPPTGGSGLQPKPALNPLSHTSPGYRVILKILSLYSVTLINSLVLVALLIVRPCGTVIVT